ncbi:zinc finger and SCAN domain-containing 29-like protein [Labeo rohita]|uniref:Zinc finger and SCAN domain-containing 29-like protein n=1 Tax=Labeo rohita TaxID=84645 RepID=A0A498L6C6_LABRO|nr:zinc finger and SCAN domain-containing 29-like protein [Labeo rohita]
MSKDGKRVNWSDEETVLFLQLWSEKNIQDKFDGTVRNNRVFKELTEKLAEAGYQRTPGQLRDKLKKAKKYYKAVKDNNACSGAERQTCPFFDILDPILKDRPSVEPTILVDTAADLGPEEETEEPDDTGLLPSENEQDKENTFVSEESSFSSSLWGKVVIQFFPSLIF